MKRKLAPYALAFLGLCFTASAFSQEASTGLGQSWPNTTDVSTNSNYHVFIFVSGGVRYIQVNDLNGNVLGSVGTANGDYLTLPIGRFSQLVSTPQQAAPSTNATPAAAVTTVYNDGDTAVTATPMSDGTLRLNASVSRMTCDPVDCNIKKQ